MNEPQATVLQFPNREEIRQDAGLWIARLDRGLTAQERTQLEQWVERDSKHAAALLDLAAVWDQTNVLSELAELFPLQRPRPAQRVFKVWSAAAAVCASVLAAAVLLYFGAVANNPDMAAARRVYETAVGSQSTVGLADGSVVTLNTNSSMEVKFTDAERTILLSRGEGFFSVAHDRDRPFRVHAGGRMFEAFGTAFNVRIGPDDGIKMMVTEGQVGVFPKGHAFSAQDRTIPSAAAAIVDSGKLAIVNAAGVSIQTLDASEVEARMSWQQGMLLFDGETLESVLLEMGRYTNAEIVIDDSVQDVRVGGYFRAGDVDGLLIALRENFAIESARDQNGRIVLSAAR